MKFKKVLALIFILAFILRLAFAFIVPIFEKPDERQHFDYISYVAEHKKLPIQVEGKRGEYFQPPFYHIIASLMLSLFRIFAADIVSEVIFLRIISSIASMVTLYFVYRISLMLFNDKKLIAGIVIFSAFLPSQININSTVTNANFGDLISTFIIFMMAKAIGKDSSKNAVILGIAAGIGLITRLSTIPAILAVPFAFSIKYYPNIRKALKPLMIIAAIALVISFWHFARSFSLYGDFLGVNAMRMDYAAGGKPVIDALYIPRLLGWTFITFWASYGVTNGIFIGNLNSTAGIIVFAVTYFMLAAISLLSFYGLTKFIKKYKNLLNKSQQKIFAVMLLHLFILLLFFISFNLNEDFQPQGRLLYPAIATLSALFVLGLYSLNNRIIKEKLPYLLFLFLAALNIASIISILNYFT